MIELANEAATEALGATLASSVRPGDVIALSGTLGAGKTTLARGLLRGLGFDGEVASPTFPIVLAYEPPDVRVPLWHVDLYRTEAATEIEQLGLDDALADSALLIEWPERLGERLWPEALALTLEITGPTARCLTAQVPRAWEERWPPS